MSHLQMNLVKACKRVAYGEVVLPGKKISRDIATLFFSKHGGGARWMCPIGARATCRWQIDGDTYVRKDVSPIQARQYQAMRIDGESSTTKRGWVKFLLVLFTWLKR